MTLRTVNEVLAKSSQCEDFARTWYTVDEMINIIPSKTRTDKQRDVLERGTLLQDVAANF